MRKSPTIKPRICERCGCTYTPRGNSQKHCEECKKEAKREAGLRYFRKMNPESKPREKCKEPCCVCGGDFSVHLDGKPYCNKHYQSMRKYGTPYGSQRSSTNKFTVYGNVLIIETAKGEQIMADASELDILQKHSWCVSTQGYAVANIGGKVVKMNCYILGLEECKGKTVDHRNRKKLDNRRKNLRLCTQKENSRNTSQPFSSKQSYLGVRKTKGGKYHARIMVDRKEVNVGRFDTEEKAIEARKEAEIKYHGEFASHKGTEVEK